MMAIGIATGPRSRNTEDTFAVIDGTLEMGVPHTFRNASDQTLKVKIRACRPPLKPPELDARL